MNCNTFERQLQAYLDNKLSASIEEEAKAHLDHCKACSFLLNQMQQVSILIKSEKNVEPNPFMLTRVMAVIEKPEPVSPKWQRAVQPAFLTIVIVLGLVLGIKLGTALSNTSQNVIPQDLVYFDDMSIESIDVIAQNN